MLDRAGPSGISRAGSESSDTDSINSILSCLEGSSDFSELEALSTSSFELVEKGETSGQLRSTGSSSSSISMLGVRSSTPDVFDVETDQSDDGSGSDVSMLGRRCSVANVSDLDSDCDNNKNGTVHTSGLQNSAHYDDSEEDDGYEGDDEEEEEKIKYHSFTYREDGNGKDCMAPPPQILQGGVLPGGLNHANIFQPYKPKNLKKKKNIVYVDPKPYLHSFKELIQVRSSLLQSTKHIMDAFTYTVSRNPSIKVCKFYAGGYSNKQKQKNSVMNTVEAGFIFRVTGPIYYGFSCAQTKLNEGSIERLKAKLWTTYFSNVVLWNPESSGPVVSIEYTYGMTHGGLRRLYNIEKVVGKRKSCLSGVSSGVLGFLGYRMILFDNKYTLIPYSKYICTSLDLDSFQEKGGPFPASLRPMKDQLQEYHLGIESGWNITEAFQLDSWTSIVLSKEENKTKCSIYVLGTEPIQNILIPKKKQQYKQLEIGSSIQYNITRHAKVSVKLQTRFGSGSDIKYILGGHVSYEF